MKIKPEKIPKNFIGLIGLLLDLIPENDILRFNLETILDDFKKDSRPDSFKLLGYWDHLNMTLYRSLYKGELLPYQIEISEIVAFIFPFWERMVPKIEESGKINQI